MNLPPEDYPALARAVCAVGNSSSFVRDASYFGTPVVLVGGARRAARRMFTTRVLPLAGEIARAITQQVARGRYAPAPSTATAMSPNASPPRWQSLPYVQKRLHYVYEEASAQEFVPAGPWPEEEEAECVSLA